MDYSETSIPTAEFDDLDWTDATTNDFVGFNVKAAELGLGPDGVLTLYGTYPGEYGGAVAVFFEADAPAGLRLQKALTSRTKEGAV